MAPRHTQGCGGAACLAMALFLVPNKPRRGVGFSFPPPAYAGIHPTLYLFGFRANALNSHSPPFLPGFDQVLLSKLFGSETFAAFGASGGLRGPPGCPGASGASGGPSGGLQHTLKRRGLVSRFFWAVLSQKDAGPSGLWGPPGASGGLRGPRGPPQASGPPGAFAGQDVGFGSGFRVFFWAASPALACQTLKYQHFPSLLQYRPGQWPPSAPAEDPRGQGRWV